MRKNLKMILSTVILVCSMSSLSFAGSWGKDSQGWWYLNDDGTYASSGWKWIDGDNDGVSECYYFDANGIMLSDTTTPDGYTVDKNGAWIQDGIVKQQAAANQVSQSRVWADGVYTLAGAANADYTSKVTITIQGNKLSVNSEWGTYTYTYLGQGLLDGYSTDTYVSDDFAQADNREVLLASADGKIYSSRENDSIAECAYESVEEHEAYVQDFRKRYQEAMHKS